MSRSLVATNTGSRFSGYIAAGLMLGLACGLFFGEYTRWIKWIGDAFVGLLQMAVLPYVAISLVANVGRLSIDWRCPFAANLGWRAVVIVDRRSAHAGDHDAGISALGDGFLFQQQFYRAAAALDWLDLFIPSNPFRSLADNSIPAVVVFSIGLGIALMAASQQDRFARTTGCDRRCIGETEQTGREVDARWDVCNCGIYRRDHRL